MTEASSGTSGGASAQTPSWLHDDAPRCWFSHRWGSGESLWERSSGAVAVLRGESRVWLLAWGLHRLPSIPGSEQSVGRMPRAQRWVESQGTNARAAVPCCADPLQD